MEQVTWKEKRSKPSANKWVNWEYKNASANYADILAEDIGKLGMEWIETERMGSWAGYRAWAVSA